MATFKCQLIIGSLYFDAFLLKYLQVESNNNKKGMCFSFQWHDVKKEERNQKRNGVELPTG
jgi:hypothetical protein